MPLTPITSSFWHLRQYGERYRQVSEAPGSARELQLELPNRTPGTKWVPPPYEVMGKGPWPDWMSFWVPLLSTAGVACLAELIAPHCELLPWIKETGHRYSLLNITTIVPRENWSCEQSSVYNNQYAAVDVISVYGMEIPHLFTLEGYRDKVFVSDTVAKLSVANSLKGAIFVHPRIPDMHLPFIKKRFGRRGTGFVTLDDDPAAKGEHLTH